MKQLSEYLDAEQVERLREFKTPPPPPKRTRRKGSLRVAAIINTLHDMGWSEFLIWDVLSRLQDLGLVEDLWDWKTEDGPYKTLGDVCGAHGLKLKSKIAKRDVGSEKRNVRVYEIPEDGVSETYCAENLITLVDDPSDTAREVANE